jgi:hypothetical protein
MVSRRGHGERGCTYSDVSFQFRKESLKTQAEARAIKTKKREEDCAGAS